MNNRKKRKYEGEYPTPLVISEKVVEYLKKCFGDDWKEKYAVWDMTCGKGNLEYYLEDLKELYLSTLNQEDIDYMNEHGILKNAKKFQYDYLNDDIVFMYGLKYISGKTPEKLNEYIENKGEGLIVLINPPYAEATGIQDITKEGIKQTNFSVMMDDLGKAGNEIYAQILSRINKELPKAKICIVSTMKYVTGDNFREFRENWSRKYLGGFAVNSGIFEGVSQGFVIGILCWDAMATEVGGIDCKGIEVDLLNKRMFFRKRKIYKSCLKKEYLKEKIKEEMKKLEGGDTEYTVPLSSAVSIIDEKKKNIKRKRLYGSLGYFTCGGNDRMAANLMTNILSTVNGRGHGFFITKENLYDVAVIFCIRKAEKINWANNKDQFTKPEREFSEVEKNEFLVWMLFQAMNLSSTLNMEYDGTEYRVRNNFIPYDDEMVRSEKGYKEICLEKYYRWAGEAGKDGKERAGVLRGLDGKEVEFMSGGKEVGCMEIDNERYICDLLTRKVCEGVIKDEALIVLEYGLKLWRKFYEMGIEGIEKSDRERYCLDTWNGRHGWYQIKKVLEKKDRKALLEFRRKYAELTKKVRMILGLDIKSKVLK